MFEINNSNDLKNIPADEKEIFIKMKPSLRTFITILKHGSAERIFISKSLKKYISKRILKALGKTGVVLRIRNAKRGRKRGIKGKVLKDVLRGSAKEKSIKHGIPLRTVYYLRKMRTKSAHGGQTGTMSAFETEQPQLKFSNTKNK